MEKGDEHRITQYLGSFISDSKKEVMERVLAGRTRYITVVLEDIFQPHNASAVIRTCDCFGVQDIHVVEDHHRYVLNPNVTMGSSKWTSLFRYNHEDGTNTRDCYKKLREQGYVIYATSPHGKGMEIKEVPLDQKIALVFGTEVKGLTTYAVDHADGCLRIPMYGFTESFNISVSAALCLHILIDKLRQSDLSWQLTEQEKAYLRLTWYRKTVRNSRILEKEFKKQNG